MDFTFDDFVGNERAIKLIKLLIHSAENNAGARVTDMAFLGPSGHGKTTLARIVAKHLDRKLVEINATVVKDPFQFRGYIVGPAAPTGGAIVLIDECHALSKKIQTNLLSATDKTRKLHTSYRDQIYRDSLPESFSFIFATTRRGYIIPELMGRLDVIEFLEYSSDEKCEMVVNYMAKQHKVNPKLLDASCIVDIAHRSRTARHIVKNCDKIIMNMKKSGGPLTKKVVEDTFHILGVDKNGLTQLDRKLLAYLAGRTSPTGLETIGDLMNMPKKDVKEELEPFLLRKNYIARSSSGRVITKKGEQALIGAIKDANARGRQG